MPESDPDYPAIVRILRDCPGVLPFAAGLSWNCPGSGVLAPSSRIIPGLSGGQAGRFSQDNPEAQADYRGIILIGGGRLSQDYPDPQCPRSILGLSGAQRQQIIPG